MIKRLRAENYKCFSRQNVPLAPLTVFTGENASGKSSVLQILALLQQSWLEQPFGRGLLVSGAELKLGKCEDLLNKQADSDIIGLEVETDGLSLRGEFSAKDMGAALAPLHTSPIIKTAPDWQEQKLLPKESGGSGVLGGSLLGEDILGGSDLNKNASFGLLQKAIHELQYITADRLGPRDTHDINYSGVYNSVGLRGERAVWFLNKYRKESVPENRCHKGGPPVLYKQVEVWMADIFPGFQFEVTPIPGTDLATLGLANKGNPELIRPQNTGFGLSYTLPIFVACLAAKKGGLVLVENPEAHLHPAAQSQFAAFLAKVSSSGVQLIIETHSDHIINGVRKAVRSGKSIHRGDVLIHFFRQEETDKQPKLISIEVDQRGNLSEWPQGFFDQLDEDFAYLTDWEE